MPVPNSSFVSLSLGGSNICGSVSLACFHHLPHINILRVQFCPARNHAPEGLPILTPMPELKNTLQFFANLHNKTNHFFAFFSIFPLFSTKPFLFSSFFHFFPPFFPRLSADFRSNARLAVPSERSRTIVLRASAGAA